MSQLDQWFPNLGTAGYAVTSRESAEYNCIGWAIGTKDNWDPAPFYRWPRGVYRAASVKNVLLVLQAEGGFEPCEDGTLEPGFEKVAVYGTGQQWTHVARQLPDGSWTSKIGFHEDIVHGSLDALAGEGDAYGDVVGFMKRPSRPQPDWAEKP